MYAMEGASEGVGTSRGGEEAARLLSCLVPKGCPLQLPLVVAL